MIEVIQGSAEWKALRAGKVTASRIADMMAKTKTGWGASRANYAAQLVAERLTGEVSESYTNAAMQWGTEHEAEARTAYEFRTDANVSEVGFVDHPTIPMTGASPDGLVGSDGMVEIKCPNTATHIDTLLNQDVETKYILQMQWQMACTGRKWCDFASFDPRMPEAMRLTVIRVNRDDVQITMLEKETVAFLAEVEVTVAALRKRYLREAA
jgi:putative phage-type endonuclease